MRVRVYPLMPRTYNKKLPRPLDVLNDRAHKAIACLAHGDEDGKPMGVADVAKRFKWQQRYLRALMKDPLFKAELAAHTAAARAALQPRAVDRLGELMESETETIALQASKAILGDDGKAPLNVNVAVNNQLGVAFKPGYVIRLPAEHERQGYASNRD